MPSTVPGPLQTLLEATSGNFCIILDLERVDGEIFRYSNHDLPLVFETETYLPNAGITISAFESMMGSDVGNMRTMGLIKDGHITEQDLRAKKFDGAKLTFRLISWATPAAGAKIISVGHVGNITWNDLRFEGEFRGIEQYLVQQFVDVTGPACRNVLGDSMCQVDLGPFTHAEEVDTVTDDHTLSFSNDATLTDGYLDQGKVIMTDGENDGMEVMIKRHLVLGGLNVLDLEEAFPFPVLAGETANLQAGCSKLLDECEAKFTNVVNYNGEPYVPGTSRLMKRGR